MKHLLFDNEKQKHNAIDLTLRTRCNVWQCFMMAENHRIMIFEFKKQQNNNDSFSLTSRIKIKKLQRRRKINNLTNTGQYSYIPI